MRGVVGMCVEFSDNISTHVGTQGWSSVHMPWSTLCVHHHMSEVSQRHDTTGICLSSNGYRVLVRYDNGSVWWLSPDNLITLQVQVDKENLIESLLISCTLLIQLLHGLCTIFPHFSYDLIIWHDIVTSHSCDSDFVTFVTWHFPTLLMCSKSKRKRKEI